MAKITTNLFGELAFLPYQPRTPITESLGWFTDIVTSYNAKEQPTQKRSKPRQFFNYEIPLQAAKKADAFNTLYGGLRDDWALAIWTESQAVASVVPSQTVIACDTLIHDLRPNSLAFLYSLEGSYEIVEIESVTATDITLFAPGVVNTITSPFLLPVRQAVLLNSADLSTSGYESLVAVEYQIKDNLLLTPVEPSQYLGDDIYFTQSEPLGSRSIGKELEKEQQIVDGVLGPIEHYSPWLYTRYNSSQSIALEGLAEVRAYKEYLYRRAGRFKRFWQPTFEHDIRLNSTGTITGTMLVDADSIIDYGTDRTHIAVLDRAGVWYPREVTAFTPISPTITQLDITPDLNVESDNVNYISYLGLNRLRNDRINLEWIGNNVVTSNVGLVETTP